MRDRLSWGEVVGVAATLIGLYYGLTYFDRHPLPAKNVTVSLSEDQVQTLNNQNKELLTRYFPQTQGRTVYTAEITTRVLTREEMNRIEDIVRNTPANTNKAENHNTK